ncbi:MAG: NADH-quinone oxidoreductase subunit I [Caldilineaceae bacterium]|nr:NADH-quinone oxidoreductase subunit I [Caldilineaceae bacterium]
MFGTGLLKGLGITLKHALDTFRDDSRGTPSRYQDSIVLDSKRRIIEQPIEQEGILTIQYPEEKRLLPERFRYIPMLIWDTETGEDRCTACGICAKVCPPQCIWIVRDIDANGRPVARPGEFFIDVAVCMSCSFCVEFCPFDAIKMNHDYELAAYDRYPQLVYDKAELTVPVEYYAALWPDQWAQEEELRRQAKEEERAKAEAKARAAAEKAARAAGEDEGAQPKRTKAELDALKEQAAAKAAARRSGNGEADSTAAATDEAEAKKARLEELKRKAAEAARKRKESEA